MSNITTFDTDLQNRIAQLLYKGLEVKEVSVICECTEQSVYDLKNSFKFAQLCYNLAMQDLMTIGANAAVSCLIEVVKDKKSARNVRVSAADKLLHYTGLRVTEQGTIEKSPATMTQAELQARMQTLQAEAANRAKVVTIDSTATTPDINNLL